MRWTFLSEHSSNDEKATPDQIGGVAPGSQVQLSEEALNRNNDSHETRCRIPLA